MGLLDLFFGTKRAKQIFVTFAPIKLHDVDRRRGNGKSLRPSSSSSSAVRTREPKTNFSRKIAGERGLLQLFQFRICHRATAVEMGNKPRKWEAVKIPDGTTNSDLFSLTGFGSKAFMFPNIITDDVMTFKLNPIESFHLET